MSASKRKKRDHAARPALSHGAPGRDARPVYGAWQVEGVAFSAVGEQVLLGVGPVGRPIGYLALDPADDVEPVVEALRDMAAQLMEWRVRGAAP